MDDRLTAVVVAFISAALSALVGFVAGVKREKREDAVAVHEMYRHLVTDLRLEIDRMQEGIDALHDENAALRGEVAELRRIVEQTK